MYFPEIDNDNDIYCKENIGFECPISKLTSVEGKKFLRGPGAYSPRKWFGFKLSKVLFGGFLTHSKKSDQFM